VAISGRLWHEHVALEGSRAVLKQNKPDGFACVSCSWAKPAHPHAEGSQVPAAKSIPITLSVEPIGADAP
jgi:hypothetical protein